MKATQTQNQNSIMGVSYEKVSVTDYKGTTRTSFIAKIGSVKYQCFSLDSLQNKITKHNAKTNNAAAQSFYDNQTYKGD